MSNKKHEEKMEKLLAEMGVTDEKSPLAKVLVQMVTEQLRQRSEHPKEEDNNVTVLEWAGFLMQTFGDGLKRPLSWSLFRKQCLHAAVLLVGAMLAVDRRAEGIVGGEDR